MVAFGYQVWGYIGAVIGIAFIGLIALLLVSVILVFMGRAFARADAVWERMSKSDRALIAIGSITIVVVLAIEVASKLR